MPKRLKMVLPVIKQTILTFFQKILNLEGHQNRCIHSKVTGILMNGWILPTGGVASGGVCACSLRSRLVSVHVWNFFRQGRGQTWNLANTLHRQTFLENILPPKCCANYI